MYKFQMKYSVIVYTSDVLFMYTRIAVLLPKFDSRIKEIAHPLYSLYCYHFSL